MYSVQIGINVLSVSLSICMLFHSTMHTSRISKLTIVIEEPMSNPFNTSCSVSILFENLCFYLYLFKSEKAFCLSI